MTEIFFDSAAHQFHLRNANISYVIRLAGGKHLLHAYFGRRISALKQDIVTRNTAYNEDNFSLQETPLDSLPQEYPSFGHGDLRVGAVHVKHQDGSRILELTYQSHTIRDGKPALNGLPATFADDKKAKTLEIITRDQSGVVVALSYTIFDDADCIARSVRIVNEGQTPVTVLSAMSTNVDFAPNDYNLVTLSGAWSRERHVYERALVPGEQSVCSVRGASSLQSSPFMALKAPQTTELCGDVYGFALVYSGNFYAGVNVDQFGFARAQMGINAFDFAWQLNTGEEFQTPEALMVYSPCGMNGMSRQFHQMAREHLIRSSFNKTGKPILINNWEATYFNFDEKKLIEIATLASKVGIEMFVLDDGWFGHRDSDDSSLGDWFEDRRKLPDGMEGLSKKIHALGLQFGLWFEPEMVSPDSELYKAHPDWCIHVEGRERIGCRRQLILDLSREEVCEYIIHAVSSMIEKAGIDYIKWDMNRNFTDAPTTELPHRYMLGLYHVMEVITQKFPNVLFESCSSGGGRFDLGMLYYMPQTWSSDDTDAYERCKIQYSTSFVFPQETMGAHFSIVPNHTLHRLMPFHTRANVAMGGTFGYELDITKLPEDELDQMLQTNRRFKAMRRLLHSGDFYRLKSPYQGDETAWMVTSKDGKEAVVTYVRTLSLAQVKPRVLKLTGLDADKCYRVDVTGETYTGDELMYSGLPLPMLQGDYDSILYHLTAE